MRRNASRKWLRGISNVGVSYEVRMPANLNCDGSLFRTRTVTARDIFLTEDCCDARRNWCNECRDSPQGNHAFVKCTDVSTCGDTDVAVTILLRAQHRGMRDEEGTTGTVATCRSDFIGLTPPLGELAHASRAVGHLSVLCLSGEALESAPSRRPTECFCASATSQPRLAPTQRRRPSP